MTTEELYINLDNKFNKTINEIEERLENKFNKTINEVEERLENKFNKSINEMGQSLENKFTKSINELDKKIDNRFDKVGKQVQELKIGMDENFKKINDKLDGVTNSNIAQILSNQTNFKNKINKENTYNKLEHKKFDCRITELELQEKYHR